NEDGNGLAFHRHERNWLLLLTGTKRWYFHGGTPVTALQRVSEESLIKAEVEAATAGELQSHEQKPGECMLIPDGYWHCTYNDPAEQDMTFGVGGMGRFHSEVEALCAFGFLAELRQTKREELSQVPQLLCTAAEQDQLQVLQCLSEMLGVDALHQAVPETGATALHMAASSGAVEVLEWMIKVGGPKLSPNLLDAHGASPGHWAARGGKLEILQLLLKAGADLSLRDAHSGVTPLHLMAAE
ncbi:unnamed protein product, partial [Cladocopium goreaui]